MSEWTGRATAADEEYPALWKNRNFRRFFVGQFVSNAGDSLYNVAILWLVFQLSGSTVLTGIANALLLLPFLLQAVAGPIVDRFPVKPVLVGSQVVQGVVVLVLPVAAYTGHMSVGLILATVPALAVTTLVVSPARATIVPRIVAEDQLSRSNSALATISLGLDMIFDALGGAFLALASATALFVFDSVTFAVATLLYLGMAIPSVETDDDPVEESPLATYFADLREGVAILRGTTFVELVATSAAFNFAVGVTLAILPAFGDLHGGPFVYGLLLGALGVGRLVGSVAASSVNDLPYGRLKTVTWLVAGGLWVGAVYAPSVPFTVALFGLAWVAAGMDDVLTETLNQRVFPPELLGRVSSLKGTASTATLPVGSLVGGVVADQVGTTPTMALAALGFGLVGLHFAVRTPLRRLPAVTDADPEDFGVEIE